MARTDYGAILSTVIKDTSDAVREVNGTSSLIAPNQWGTAIRTMHSDTDYENALEQMIEETATGDIASFSDGANDIPLKNLACTINPVQDLHGQDYPYPAGGGKNKLGYTSGTTETLNGSTMLINADGSCKVTSSGQTTGSHFFVYKTLRLPVGSYYLYGLVNGSVWTYDTNDKLRLYVAYNGGGYNFGTVLNVADESKDIVVYIQAKTGFTYNDTVQLMISEGSTAPTKWSPYSNICPITGHTELNLVHTGANIWDEEWEVGNIDSSGTDQPTDNSIRSKNYIPCIPNTNYYKYIGGSKNGQLFFYEKDKTFISRTGNAPSGVVTSPSNAYFMRFASYSDYGATYNHDISINYPSTDTSYHAYTGSTTTTTFGTTVYGGTLDVVSGVLTIDRAIVDLSTFTLGTLGDVYIWYKAFDNILVPASNSEIGQVISEYYAPIRYNGVSGTPNTIAIRTNAYMYVNTGGNTTPQGNAVYKLATPTTTQLTPQEVKSLLGGNNIYHDCNGQVAVTYRANGQLYVQQHS